MLLTKTQLAQEAGVPESTARNWIGWHGDFVPAVPGGRYSRYDESCIEVLQLIATLYAAKASRDEVDAELRKRYAPTLEAQPPDATPQPSFVVELAAAVHEAAATIDEGAKARDAALMEELRALRLALENARRPWWRRVVDSWRGGG